MNDGLATTKMSLLMKMSRSCTPSLVMCDRRRDLRSKASEVGIRFGAEQSNLNSILDMSKGFGKMCFANVYR